MSSGELSSSRAGRRSLSSMSTTSLSFSHAINNIDGNKPAVVLEIGARLTKCGFAGEWLPRAIMRTEFIDEGLVTQREFLDDLDLSNKDGLAKLYKFLKHIYYTQLLCMPRERRVVIVESLLCPTKLRNSIAHVVLEMLHAPSVLFAPSHLLATFPFNANSALVIDIGYRETVVIPIAEGVTMLSEYGISQKGAAAVEQRIRSLLCTHGMVEDVDGTRRPITQAEWQVIDDIRLIEDIMVRALFVTRMDRGRLIQSGSTDLAFPPEALFPLGREQLVVSGFVREAAAEVLFENQSESDQSLAHLIHGIVSRCPIDLRRKFFSRLLVVGGPSLLPGFLPRLRAEIRRLGEERQLKTTDEIKFHRFEQSQFELFLSWMGGSMFGSLTDVLNVRSLAREDWMAHHVLADCVQLREETAR